MMIVPINTLMMMMMMIKRMMTQQALVTDWSRCLKTDLRLNRNSAWVSIANEASSSSMMDKYWENNEISMLSTCYHSAGHFVTEPNKWLMSTRSEPHKTPVAV